MTDQCENKNIATCTKPEITTQVNAAIQTIKESFKIPKQRKKSIQPFFIDASKSTEVERIELDAIFEDKTVKVIFDRGSKDNYIGASLIDEEKTRLLSKSKFITVANGQKQEIKREAPIILEFLQIPNATFSFSSLILPGLPSDIILGISFMTKFETTINFKEKQIRIKENLIEIPTGKIEELAFPDKQLTEKVYLLENQQTIVSQLLNTYNENTLEYGLIPNVTHKINLKENCSIQAKPYPIPNSVVPRFKDEIKRLLSLGIINHSNSRFASPCFPLVKPSGDIRLIIDYRILNSFTENDPFLIPRIEELLSQLRDSVIFSRLDMKNGYYQISVHKPDVPKTAFVSPFGHYEFTRMPFGLTTAPRTFQRTISKIFTADNEVLVFIDDILIHNKSLTEHETSLKKVMKKVVSNNIQLNVEKCEFFRNSVKYLGNIIEHNLIRPDKESLKIHKPGKPPKSFRELRRVLGFVNWFRPYVPSLSDSTAELTELLKLKKFTWNEKLTHCLENVWNKLENAVVLNIPDQTSPFCLYTDASQKGISGVLLQQNALIRVFSAKLSPVEQRYSAVERECLAIIKAMLNFRTLVYNARTYIYTDNRNITFQKPLKNSRLQRWTLILPEFSFFLIHIEGKSNQPADFMSRLETVEDTKKSLTLLTKESNDILKEIKDLITIDHISRLQEKDIENGNINTKNLKKIFVENYFIWVDEKIRVILPKELQATFIKKLHEVLLHAGQTRMLQTIAKYIHFPNIRKEIENLCISCETCQITKNRKSNYGELRGTLTCTTPFHTISSDLFGPIDLQDFNEDGKAMVITFIDFATRVVGLGILRNSRGKHVIQALKQVWLEIYPVPKVFHTDQGP